MKMWLQIFMYLIVDGSKTQMNHIFNNIIGKVMSMVCQRVTGVVLKTTFIIGAKYMKPKSLITAKQIP